jgi:hypothetical protein
MEVMLEQSCRSLPRGGDQTFAPSSRSILCLDASVTAVPAANSMNVD